MAFRMIRAVLVLVLLLAGVFPRVFAKSSSSSQDSAETGQVVSVRQIKRAGFPIARYSATYDFTVDFAVKAGTQTYCTGYETPVLDEVQDLEAANGKQVRLEVHGHRITVILPSGRRINAQLVKSIQC